MNKDQLMYPWVILIGNYLWNLLSKYWIFVCTGMMLLISIQEVVVYRIVYLILFLLFMLTFQVNLLTSPLITGKIMIFFELSDLFCCERNIMHLAFGVLKKQRRKIEECNTYFKYGDIKSYGSILIFFFVCAKILMKNSSFKNSASQIHVHCAPVSCLSV